MQYLIIRRVIASAVFMVLVGCASSSELAKQAAYHQKSSEYYQSIGQPETAKEEAQLAKKYQDQISNFPSIVSEIFGRIFNQ